MITSARAGQNKIQIEQENIITAINMINKEKAIGIDNVSLKPLLKRHALHLFI